VFNIQNHLQNICKTFLQVFYFTCNDGPSSSEVATNFHLYLNRSPVKLAISQLRFEYDTTTTKNWRSFLLASNRVEWKQARAIRRSRIVVVWQSNRTHIVISITPVVVKCVVVSSYRSRVVVESQLWYRLTIRLRVYDPTTTYRARLLPFDANKKWTCQFFVVVVL